MPERSVFAVVDPVVYNNRSGMAPTMLKIAMAFGGSMSFGAPDGIARFGMGMKEMSYMMGPAGEATGLGSKLDACLRRMNRFRKSLSHAVSLIKHIYVIRGCLLRRASCETAPKVDPV